MLSAFSFGVLRAAVFAEPAITQIEEVGCLVHGTRSLVHQAHRLESGDSIKRTGTDVFLPFRQM